MEWWVITDFNISNTTNSFRPSLTSNVPAHIFMTWDYTKPTRHPIWRTIRGVLKLCGYGYKWDSPNIEEQEQAGDSGLHTFPVTGLEAHEYPRWVWFYFHSPLANEGNQCQSALMNTVLPPPPTIMQWNFDVDLEGWTQEIPTVQWLNDGHPNPGCLQMVGAGTARTRSPAVDVSGFSNITLSIWVKQPSIQGETMSMQIYKNGVWYAYTHISGTKLPWTFKNLGDISWFISPQLRFHFQQGYNCHWQIDTVHLLCTP